MEDVMRLADEKLLPVSNATENEEVFTLFALGV
jgi:hypothetical protein